ncbi:cytochrome P450 6g1-like [Haematobia irritans]|uniref:cytochrome P450 6g1-like n=1 Tax=Haematobia irritans TaxID=7368 RepID=UPI003F4F5BB9
MTKYNEATLTFLGLVILAAFLCYRWYKKHFSYWQRQAAIPSVPGHIFSGCLKDMLAFKTNLGFHMKTIYDDPKFEHEAVVGIYTVRPALLIRDPELIRSILIRDFDCFRNRYTSSDPHSDPIGGLGIFMARDALWKEWRTKLSTVFTSGKMKEMYPLVQEVGKNLENYLSKNGERFVCEMKDLGLRYISDSIATTMFGIESNSLENHNDEVYSQSLRIIDFDAHRAFNFLIMGLMPKWNRFFKPSVFFKDTEDFLRSASAMVLKERETTRLKRNDLIDLFVKFKAEVVASNGNLEEFMQIIAGQLGVFIAGDTETSSTTIANVLLEVAKHPDIQDRLRKEICDAFVQGNGSVSYDAINNIPYLDMVVNETLRLYPVFPMLERQYSKGSNDSKGYSLKPFYDFNIPDGMAVYISVYGLHYDSKYWPDPKRFNPERFVPENKKSMNHMIYLPFSDGPRHCIGRRLGYLQVKTCVAHMLKNHRVQVCSQTNLNAEFNPKIFVLQTIGGTHLEVVRDDLYDRSKCKENK